MLNVSPQRPHFLLHNKYTSWCISNEYVHSTSENVKFYRAHLCKENCETIDSCKAVCVDTFSTKDFKRRKGLSDHAEMA